MAKLPKPFITPPSLLSIDVSKLQRLAWEAKMRKMTGHGTSAFASKENYSRWINNPMEGLNPDFRDIMKKAIIKGLAHDGE